MKREDVAGLLAQADKFGAIAAAGFRSSVPVDPSELRALCKRWLAAEDAPRGYVGAVELEHDEYCSEVWTEADTSALAGKHVRIVPEGGGDGR